VDPSLAGRAADASSGWGADDLAAAAMLHTDILLKLVKHSRPEDAAAQMHGATTLLRAAVARDPARAAFARRWRSTVTALVHAFGSPALSDRLRDDGLAWLTTSERAAAAEASFQLGLTSEIRAAVAGPLSGAVPMKAVAVSRAARHELTEAARHFEDALAADRDCAEAALHLGRIRLLDARDAEAERALRSAAASASVPIRYLALLFLGTVAERQSRFEDAEAQYRAALNLFRWGQSAPLALSHVLMRIGREPEARALLAGHFDTTRGRTVDPLWAYLSDPATDLGPALDLLRAETWR
jgi:tetratricopeptide (TPR) repeat protein